MFPLPSFDLYIIKVPSFWLSYVLEGENEIKLNHDVVLVFHDNKHCKNNVLIKRWITCFYWNSVHARGRTKIIISLFVVILAVVVSIFGTNRGFMLATECIYRLYSFFFSLSKWYWLIIFDLRKYVSHRWPEWHVVLDIIWKYFNIFAF